MTAACPSCRGRLDGGPVLFWCPCCRANVWAADLDHDYRPPGPAADVLGRAA